MRVCGTWGHNSVVDLKVMGYKLDLMILEFFPNLNNSIILYIHCGQEGGIPKPALPSFYPSSSQGHYEVNVLDF